MSTATQPEHAGSGPGQVLLLKWLCIGMAIVTCVALWLAFQVSDLRSQVEDVQGSFGARPSGGAEADAAVADICGLLGAIARANQVDPAAVIGTGSICEQAAS